jgi:hypothetical protein
MEERRAFADAEEDDVAPRRGAALPAVSNVSKCGSTATRGRSPSAGR